MDTILEYLLNVNINNYEEGITECITNSDTFRTIIYFHI